MISKDRFIMPNTPNWTGRTHRSTQEAFGSQWGSYPADDPPMGVPVPAGAIGFVVGLVAGAGSVLLLLNLSSLLGG